MFTSISRLGKLKLLFNLNSYPATNLLAQNILIWVYYVMKDITI